MKKLKKFVQFLVKFRQIKIVYEIMCKIEKHLKDSFEIFKKCEEILKDNSSKIAQINMG